MLKRPIFRTRDHDVIKRDTTGILEKNSGRPRPCWRRQNQPFLKQALLTRSAMSAATETGDVDTETNWSSH